MVSTYKDGVAHAKAGMSPMVLCAKLTLKFRTSAGSSISSSGFLFFKGCLESGDAVISFLAQLHKLRYILFSALSVPY